MNTPLFIYFFNVDRRCHFLRKRVHDYNNVRIFKIAGILGPGRCLHIKLEGEAELKTEEGYSADIVRTYIPGDICPHNVGTMSAQCPHYVRTTSHEGYMSHEGDVVWT